MLKFISEKKVELENYDEKAIDKLLDDATNVNLISKDEKVIISTDFYNIKKTGKSDIPPTDNNPSPNKDLNSSTGSTLDQITGVIKNTPGTLSGLLWLLVLYFFSTWITIGSLSSIQFGEDIYKKFNTNFYEILKGIGLRQELDEYRKNNEATEWKRILIKRKIDLNKPEDIKTAEIKYCAESDTYSQMDCNVLKKYTTYIEEINIKESEIKSLQHYNGSEGGKPTEQNDLWARVGFMDNFGYMPLLTMPEQVLLLLLSIAMGILGSTITMTWTFLSEKSNPQFRWYLLRPFVGGLSALVIFIFAKAGQMTLAADTANASLSPFLLSLFGIAAGLLSDRAYSQMSSISGRVLGDIGNEQARWASNLEEKLAEKKITSEDLAASLNLDKGNITAIVIGQKSATLQEQQRISDRLGIHPRYLFTDIHP